MKRLLDVAKQKNNAHNFTVIKIKITKDLEAKLVAACALDSIKPSVIVQAVILKYIERHPAILAVVDDMLRDKTEAVEVMTKKFGTREIDDIYTAINSGILLDED